MITRTPIIDDDGTGTTGTVLDNAWKQELYDQIDGTVGAASPPFVDLPYNAATYGVVGTGSWVVEAGDQIAYRYRLVGKILDLIVTVATTSIVGSVTFVTVLLPLGLAGKFNQGGTLLVLDGAGSVNSWWANNTGNTIIIARNDNAPWAPQTNTLQVRFSIRLEVQ